MTQFKLFSLVISLCWILPISAITYSERAGFKNPLSIEEMPDNPMTAFQSWYQEASKVETEQRASSMTLSTATPDGRPSSRMMLMKGVDDQGLIFYGDLRSSKFEELRKNPFASIVFYWPSLQRQVILSGKAVPVHPEVAEAYFKSRRKQIQASSYASTQGSTLRSREELLKAHREELSKYGTEEIPTPTHWGGFQLIPDRVEFWQAGPNNLHSRVEYTKSNGHWKKQLLNP